ncbi:hypothetical protein SLA2020_040210 [Shorea laevis]
MEGDEEQLTEQETALYDRQIRVWGADAQRRLSKSHILVHGMKGTVAEFCKNIVLAGVGSVTLVDDRMVTEEALSANFLIPPEENAGHGKTLAELCCDSLKEFNPMVHVSFLLSCEKEIDQSEMTENYKYSKEKIEETIDCQLEYPSFEEAISVPWTALRGKVSKLYFAMRVIEHFEEIEDRNPGDISITDLHGLLNLKKELCEANSLKESHVPDALLERLVKHKWEFPPVCVIIGGFLGQEVIKAISGKGDPLKNFFYFDALDGKGLIEDISNANTKN